MNRNSLPQFDFSAGSDFRERLLKQIKAECFSALEDDDLEFVNAAGTADLPLQGDLSVIRTEDFGKN